MLNSVIEGISKKLNLVFGNAYTIYDDEVKQDMKEPCFFILSLSPSQEQVIGKRYFRTQPFDIHYFPSTKDKNNEMNDIADSLYDALEYVTLNDIDILHGTSLNHQIVDGVLHFFVNYNFHIYKLPDVADNMEELKVNNGVNQ